MPVARHVLADGQVPATIGIVYRVPRGKSAEISNVRVYNTNVAQQTIGIRLNVNGTARRFGRAVLAQDAFADLLDKPIKLDELDAVMLETTTAAAVDYLVLGSEAA